MEISFTKSYPLKSINYIQNSQEELWEKVTLCVDFFTAVLFISVYTHESTLDQNLRVLPFKEVLSCALQFFLAE